MNENPDTDPMLGDAETQRAYHEKIMQMMRDEMEAIREKRRQKAAQENPPVIIGTQGFGDGPRAV